MISRQLLDLLNSGEAIAIVGSGISAEAGLPFWTTLFSSIADALDGDSHDTSRARRIAAENGKLPEAFDLLAALTSRPDIHKRKGGFIQQVTNPGPHHVRLADWPFRLYVTRTLEPGYP